MTHFSISVIWITIAYYLRHLWPNMWSVPVFNGQYILGNFILFWCWVLQHTSKAWQRDCSIICIFNTLITKKVGIFVFWWTPGWVLYWNAKYPGVKPPCSKWPWLQYKQQLWECWTWQLCGNFSAQSAWQKRTFKPKSKSGLPRLWENQTIGLFFVLSKSEKECCI